MATMERPDEKEMLYQLWYAIIGSNGDGIASQVRQNSEDIKVLSDRVAAPHQCLQAKTITEMKREVDALMQTPGKIALKVIGTTLAVIGTGALGWILALVSEHVAK